MKVTTIIALALLALAAAMAAFAALRAPGSVALAYGAVAVFAAGMFFAELPA